jgi:hypothetical protein
VSIGVHSWWCSFVVSDFYPPPTKFGCGHAKKGSVFGKTDVAAFSVRTEALSSSNLTIAAMRFSTETVENRRGFFRAAMRYGLLGLLAAAASLAARKPGPTGQRCINLGICKGCGAFAECELPRALSVKQSRGRST